MAKLPINEDILPPYDDYIFKTLMTRPESKPILADLLSACIGRVVTDVQIKNNELPITDIEEKNERLDVNCLIDGKIQADVEMQGSRIEETQGGHINFTNKYIYYMTDLHSSQKSKGVEYTDLAQTYQITFSMYTVYEHIKDYITHACMRTKDGRLISEQINMIVIELSKLGEILKKPVGEMTPIEMWSVFLGYADKPKYRGLVNELIERKEVFDMAGTVLTEISKDEHERAKLMSRRKVETDRASNLIAVERRGHLKGLEEGLKKGIKKGHKEGEKKATITMARNMKSSGLLSIEQISQISGFTIDEIERL